MSSNTPTEKPQPQPKPKVRMETEFCYFCPATRQVEYGLVHAAVCWVCPTCKEERTVQSVYDPYRRIPRCR